MLGYAEAQNNCTTDVKIIEAINMREGFDINRNYGRDAFIK